MKLVIQDLDKSLQEKDNEKAKKNVITLRYLVSLESSIKAKYTRLGFVS